MICFFAISTYGQKYQSFDIALDLISRTAKWRVGPFGIAPTIQLRNIGYDTNVYGQREEDDPIGDHTATLSPQAKIYLLFRKWLIFSFSENPEYVYFFNEKSERGLNHNFFPSLKVQSKF
jgi:hypothetical protein